jgi:hypothetical protein
VIVLGIIIVATFYSQEFNNLIAGVVSTDQVNEPRSEANGKLLASSATLDESEYTARSRIKTEAAVVANTVSEEATKVVEPARSGSNSSTLETTPAETVADNVYPPPNTVTSMEYQAPYTGRQYNYASPYTAPMPYGMPEQYRQDYNEMMAARGRVYERTKQARREHAIKMHQYRAVAQKRIEQNRLDIHNRLQALERENQRKRDELMHRLERIEQRAINRPI